MNRPDLLFCIMRCYSNSLLSIVAAAACLPKTWDKYGSIYPALQFTSLPLSQHKIFYTFSTQKGNLNDVPSQQVQSNEYLGQNYRTANVG